MIIGNLGEESDAARILALVERCCPRFMRIGGGPISEDYNVDRPQPNRIGPEQKVKALELAKTGKFTGTEIAVQIGSSQSAVFKLCHKNGIVLPNGNAKAHRHKRRA